MFSARGVLYQDPMPQLQCGDHLIEWVSSFKYLGYWLTTKLGWGNIISKIRVKTRQRATLVNSFKYSGTSSTQLRRVLFSTFVQPHFTWLFGILPLFTNKQQRDQSSEWAGLGLRKTAHGLSKIFTAQPTHGLSYLGPAQPTHGLLI
jgi:hypothetical protein